MLDFLATLIYVDFMAKYFQFYIKLANLKLAIYVTLDMKNLATGEVRHWCYLL
jgi:hypothetical protein